jgi:hypothetical protein
MVARTVWTLWENDLSIIWDLLRRWTDDSDVLLETCEEIVELGFEKYRFSAEEVFHTVESWLTTDAPGNQRAAANLLQLILPAITKESLSKLTSQWTAADLEKSLFGFSRAMRQIFYKEPSWTLKTFQQWARSQKEIYDQLIADTLELVSPPDGPPEFYAAFEKQLIALRMASRNTRISTETQRLVKLTRDLRSRSGHDPAHQRIDPRLPRAKRKRGKSFR